MTYDQKHRLLELVNRDPELTRCEFLELHELLHLFLGV